MYISRLIQVVSFLNTSIIYRELEENPVIAQELTLWETFTKFFDSKL